MRRFYGYLVASAVFWAIAAYTLWGVVNSLRSFCNRQEAESGLAAECLAPAAVVFTAMFAILLLIDLVRLGIMFSLSRNARHSNLSA